MTATFDPAPLEASPNSHLLAQLKAANAIMQNLGMTRDLDSGTMRVQDDPRAIAQAVAEGIVEQLHMANARVWFFDPGDRSLHLVAQAGLNTPADARIQHILPDDSPLGQVIQHREPLLSNTLGREPWILYPEWSKNAGLVGFAGYPIMLGDEPLGSLAAFSYEPLAPEFLEVLKLICTHTASAIANARQNCQLRRQSEQQVLLNRITDHIRHTLNLDEILQSAVTELGKALGASRVQFLFGNARDAFVTYRHAYAAPGLDNWAGRQISVRGNSLAAELFAQDEAIAIRAWSNVEELGPAIAQVLTEAGVESMMMASIRLGKGSYGVLSVHQCRSDYQQTSSKPDPSATATRVAVPEASPRAWSRSERELLESITEQLAIAINQSRLYERTQQQARREALLNEVSSDIRNSLDPNQVLESIVQSLAASLELERCTIELYEPDTEFPPTSASQNANKDHPPDSTILSIYDTLSNGYPAVVTQSDWPHIAVAEREFFKLDRPATIALMPLLQEGELHGTITMVATPDNDRFQPDEITLAIAVAEQAGIALKQAQLYVRTRRLALRENLLRQMAQHLTGTYELKDIVRVALAGMADVLQVDRCAYVTLSSQSLSSGPNPADAETIQQFVLERESEARSPRQSNASPAHFYIAQEFRRTEAVSSCLNCTISDDLSWLLLLNCYGKRTSLLIEDLQSAELSPESRQRMAEDNMRSLLAVPLIVDRDIVGVLCTSLAVSNGSFPQSDSAQPAAPRTRSFESDELDLVQALADMAAVAIQRAQFYERARLQDATAAAMRGLSEGREAESRRLAADLHDQTLADLGALSRHMQHLVQDETLPPTAIRQTLTGLDSQLKTTIAELRRIVEDLKPTAMLAFNFSSALRSLLDRAIERSLTPLLARFDDRSNGRVNDLDSFSQTTLFRIIQEALNNIVKHADAKRVDFVISVSAPDPNAESRTAPVLDRLDLKIIDDGKGIPEHPQRVGSHGLLNMQYRAELIGGTIAWRSRRTGSGTIVAISIPLPSSS